MLRNEGMGGIRLSKSSVQMLDIVALLLRMRRVNSALTLIFRKKSNLINGKSSLGDGWSNVPSPGSTIPDVSAKIMRFPSLLLRLWLKSPISIPYSSAYEYSFLLPSPKIRFVRSVQKYMSAMIILAVPSSYFHRGVVWSCVAKVGGAEWQKGDPTGGSHPQAQRWPLEGAVYTGRGPGSCRETAGRSAQKDILQPQAVCPLSGGAQRRGDRGPVSGVLAGAGEIMYNINNEYAGVLP